MLRRTSLLALLFLAATPALAQRGGLGIGGQVGDPTGLTLRAGTLDLAAGWNLSTDSFFAQGHVILGERGLGGAPADLRLFYGPGLFVGVRDRPRSDDRVSFGLSLNGGLAYFAGPIELFGQLTPRLQLVDETAFTLGGALGLRYYF